MRRMNTSKVIGNQNRNEDIIQPWPKIGKKIKFIKRLKPTPMINASVNLFSLPREI